jgi:uncharacterized SAM-binding protein YcdF (DUF218 family)
MFFTASKLLAFIVSPIFWIILIALTGLFYKDKRKKNLFFGSSLLMLYLFSNAFILDEVMRKWEVPAVQFDQISGFDVGIVLGGMSSYDKQFKRINFYSGTDRLLQAVELYNRGCIKKIFISGGSGSILHPDEKEAIPLRSFLLSIHIPEKDVLIESESKNTHENALFTKESLKKFYPHGGRFLLISSGFHLPRALQCFHKEGLEVTPFSTDRYSGKRKFHPDHLLIPYAQTLFTWDVLCHEWLGFITYKLSGYI